MVILKYNSYTFNNYLNESMVFEPDDLMDNVDSKKIDFNGEPFNFNINQFGDDYSIDKLRENPDFNSNLSKNELFISEYNNTKDFDTFLVDDIKYILIHKREDRSMSKLEKLKDPEYVIIQTKGSNDKW